MSEGPFVEISGPPEFDLVGWPDIARRNVGVGLLLAVGGLLGGLPTMGLLASNGFTIGSASQAFLGSSGSFPRLLLMTLPHGLVEVPALLIFGAVGLGIASHVLHLLGIRSDPPRAARLVREAVVALFLLLAAAVLEVKLTPLLTLAAWSGAANLWLDTSLRWLAILVIEGGALLALSLLFDHIDRAPEQVRQAWGKFASLTGPVWAVVMVAIGFSLNQAQVESWNSTQNVLALLLFGFGCGLPPLLYTVARGYRAQLDLPPGGLSIHAPWLVRAALMIGGGYAVLGAGYWIAPGLSLTTRAFLTVTIMLTLASLTGPMLVRRWWAREHPMDWSSHKGTVAAELADRLAFPRSRIHLLELRSGNRLVNAMATGLVPGSARIFVTVDLMEELTAEEVAAVLAHEIGHVRGRHLRYVFVLQLGLLALLNGAMIVLRNWVELIEPVVLGAVVYAMVVTALGPVLFPVSIAAAMRVAERKADRYAASVGSGEALASAIERRAGAGRAIERTPIIIRAFWLHPSPSSRVEALRTASSV
jgi:Zn-dependent protease with chaperone function